MRSLLSVSLAFSLSFPVFATDRDCEEHFSQFLSLAQEVTPQVVAYYDPSQPISKWMIPLHRLRDQVRRLFQILHEGDYPIIALDDATPVNAYALATDAFGKLPPEQRSLVDLQKIKEGVFQLLEDVEKYPLKLRQFIDETASLAAEERVLASFLKKNSASAFTNEIDLPVIHTRDDGSVEVESRKEYFGNEVQILNSLKRIRRKLRERNGSVFFGLDESNNMAVAHAIHIKKLETYMHELKRAQSLNPGQSLPEDLQGVLTRISSLYEGEPGKSLKAQFKPPLWASNRIHWMQLGGELRSVFEKDFPRLIDREQNQKIIQFIQNLTPEERRALGITDAAKAVDLLSRTKWLSVIPLGSTLGGGLYEGALRAYDYFIADSKAKEHCASLEEDLAFVECVQEYLQVRFPQQVIWEQFTDQAAFVNIEGQVTDPKVINEVEDVMRRRQKLIQREKFYENARAQLSEFVKQMMEDHDLSSQHYRRRVIEMPEEEGFILGLIGSENPKIPSYLQFQFPLDFKLYRLKIQTILRAGYGSEDQQKGLDELYAQTPALTDELKALLNERQRFKKWGNATPPSPQAGIVSTSPGSGLKALPWFWFRR